MTDRVNHLTVVLDKDYRDDDVQAIVEAICMLKGVASVGVNVTNPSDYSNRELAKYQLIDKLWEVLKS